MASFFLPDGETQPHRNGRPARFNLFRRIAFAAFLFVVAGAVHGAAKDDIRAGVARMASGAHAAALAHFEAAARADPKDPEAKFFVGTALNRLGRSAAALRMLDGALYLYSVTGRPLHPDLHFERGWALLRERHYEDALEALEAYELQRPGRGQTSEFMGRAYIGLERYELAEQKLNEAVSRDADLEPTVRLALTTVAQRRGDAEGAERELQALVKDEKPNPLTALLAERLVQPPRRESRPWALSFGVGGGYNDNAIAVGDDEPIGSEVSNQSDTFLRVIANAAYTWRPEDWRITASYILQMDRYEDVSRVNQLDHIAGVRVDRDITRDVGIGLRFQEQYTLVDDDSFRNEIRAVPSVSWRVHERAVAELSYMFVSSNFLVPVLSAPLERDNETHIVAPMLYISLPEYKTNVRVGYQGSWSDADGSDYDYDGNRFSLQFDFALPANISGRLYYSFENRDYDNPNSSSGFVSRRDDDFNYLDLYLSRKLSDLLPVAENLSIYMQYSFSDRSSNIGFFSYDQHSVGGGLLWQF